MHRRSFLLGIGALIAAPAVVQAASLMPVRRPSLWLAQPRLFIITEISWTLHEGTEMKMVEAIGGGSGGSLHGPFVGCFEVGDWVEVA